MVDSPGRDFSDECYVISRQCFRTLLLTDLGLVNTNPDILAPAYRLLESTFHHKKLLNLLTETASFETALQGGSQGPAQTNTVNKLCVFKKCPDSCGEGLMFMIWIQVLFSETPYLTGLSAVFTIERISRGVYMTPGRLSRRREFTPVSSSGPVFVYMVPTQNAIPARVTLAWAHSSCCTGARISLRYEISQTVACKRETTTRFGVKSVCR